MAVSALLPQNLTTPDVVKLGTLGLLLGVLATAVYRLYFHPLAKYPGPFWARISGIPQWWHTYKKERHLWIQQLHEQYGKLNRVCSPSHVPFCSYAPPPTCRYQGAIRPKLGGHQHAHGVPHRHGTQGKQQKGPVLQRVEPEARCPVDHADH